MCIQWSILSTSSEIGMRDGNQSAFMGAVQKSCHPWGKLSNLYHFLIAKPVSVCYHRCYFIIIISDQTLLNDKND